MIAIGPNGSSFIALASFGSSVTTVGSQKLPLSPIAMAAGAHLAAVLARVLDVGLHRLRAARVGERAHR